MSDIIVTIVGAVIAVLGALITRYFIPWIKERANTESLNTAMTVIEALVMAAWAEGVKNGWDGNNQKAWAIAKAKEFGLDLTEIQYDLLRKAVVAEVKGLADAVAA
jgi:hypothetical protein